MLLDILDIIFDILNFYDKKARALKFKFQSSIYFEDHVQIIGVLNNSESDYLEIAFPDERIGPLKKDNRKHVILDSSELVFSEKLKKSRKILDKKKMNSMDFYLIKPNNSLEISFSIPLSLLEKKVFMFDIAFRVKKYNATVRLLQTKLKSKQIKKGNQ